jgi:hypothetical protein
VKENKMINIDLSDITSLQEFYSVILSGQKEAHGNDYHEQHAAICKYLSPDDVYMELGTHQGATAARAMLNNPKEIILIDNNMEKYRKFLKPIAEQYCLENNINLIVHECSSIDPACAHKADILLIDSLHNRNHMEKELQLHGKNIKKYIIAHDTSIINGRNNDSLYQCLVNFAKNNGWEEIERGTNNVGYTVIEKKQ